MYKNLKVIRLVPDMPGRGGIKVGTHSFQKAQTEDTINLVDGVVRYGAWQIAPKISSAVLATMPTSFDETVTDRDASNLRVLNMHVFKRYPGNPTVAPTEEIILHSDTNTTTESTVITNMTVDPWGGGIRTIAAFTEVCEAAKMITIKDRMFYTVGTYQACIYAGPKSDVIIGNRGGYPASSDPRPPNYVLGIGQPQNPPVVIMASATPSTHSNTKYYCGKGRTVVVSPEVSSPIGKFIALMSIHLFEDPAIPGTYLDKAITVPGTSGTTTSVEFTSGPFPFPVADTKVCGDPGATRSPRQGVFLGSPYVNLTQDLGALGNDVEMYVGATFTWPYDLGQTKYTGVVKEVVSGQLYDFSTGPFASATYSYLLLDTPIGTPMGVDPGFPVPPGEPKSFSLSGARAGIASAVSAVVRAINLDCEYVNGTSAYTLPSGLRYAYAWYDPVTGHISNISPITTDPTLIMAANDLAISIDSLDYPPAQDALRFTHILFFRTLRSGGSSLFVVGGLDPGNLGTFHGIESTANYPKGVITCIAKAGIADGKTITISDGVTPVIFEFDTVPNGVAGTNVVVDISADVTAIQVAARLATAINGVAGFKVTASIPTTPDGTVHLVNDVPGVAGVVPITTTLATIIVSGMSYSAYWFDTYPDTELLVSGALRAPQFTNGKPILRDKGVTEILSPSQIAYWDGRVWLYSQRHVTAIHFSCDMVQCPFGVPEESFPETNVLNIPSDDGRVTAMKVIGDKLLIVTDRWAYVVVGSNETNYRLIKVSNWLGSVAYFQMVEVAGESDIDPALVCFLAPDRRVYAMSLGQEPVCISLPIQPIIDAYFDFNMAGLGFGGTYRSLRLHATIIGGKRFLVLWSVNWPKPNTTASLALIFDFEQKVWQEWTPKETASGITTNCWLGPIASAYGGTLATSTIGRRDLVAIPQRDATYTEVYLRSWFDLSEGDPASTFAVTTFPATFDVQDLGGKRRKVLQYIKAYVSNAETLSGVITVVNGATLVDGNYFTLVDDVAAYVFEYDSNSSYTSGHYRIVFGAGDTVGQIRDATIAVINASPILCTASIGGAATINLTMDNGHAGNPNSENCAGGFAVTGMLAPPWNVDLYVDGYAVKTAPMYQPDDGFNAFHDYTGVCAYQWEAGATVREVVAYGPTFTATKEPCYFHKMAAKIKMTAVTPSARHYVYAVEIGFNYANEDSTSEP